MNQDKAYFISGELILNVVARQAYYGKKTIKLSDLSFKVLMTLIQSYPDSVSHQAMIDQVWQKVAVSPETVTQRIALIRKAFTDVGLEHSQYMVATRHIGYRWLKPVKKQDTPASINKQKWLLTALLVFGFLITLGLITLDLTGDDQPEVNTSASFSADDLSEQAWVYLDKHTSNSNELAIGLFKQALLLDQQNLNALTGLSIAYSHQVTKFNANSDLLDDARVLANQAIQLDRSHAQAWAALAFVDDARGELDLAITGYEKALKLNSSNSSVISSLAYLYAKKGRLLDAMRLNVSVLGSKQLYLDLQIGHVMEIMGFDTMAERWYRKADVLSPDNVFATFQRAQFYFSKNQRQMALATINEALERGVNRPELPVLLGLDQWMQGDTNAAFDYFQQAMRINPNDLQTKTLFTALLLDRQSSEKYISKLQAFESHTLNQFYSWPDEWVYHAHFYAHLGARDKALNSLQKAYDTGYRNHRWLENLPAFLPLKNSKEWQQLIQNMQSDVYAQRELLLSADWLPASFLDPQIID